MESVVGRVAVMVVVGVVGGLVAIMLVRAEVASRSSASPENHTTPDHTGSSNMASPQPPTGVEMGGTVETNPSKGEVRVTLKSADQLKKEGSLLDALLAVISRRLSIAQQEAERSREKREAPINSRESRLERVKRDSRWREGQSVRHRIRHRNSKLRHRHYIDDPPDTTEESNRERTGEMVEKKAGGETDKQRGSTVAEINPKLERTSPSNTSLDHRDFDPLEATQKSGGKRTGAVLTEGKAGGEINKTEEMAVAENGPSLEGTSPAESETKTEVDHTRSDRLLASTEPPETSQESKHETNGETGTEGRAAGEIEEAEEARVAENEPTLERTLTANVTDNVTRVNQSPATNVTFHRVIEGETMINADLKAVILVAVPLALLLTFVLLLCASLCCCCWRRRRQHSTQQGTAEDGGREGGDVEEDEDGSKVDWRFSLGCEACLPDISYEVHKSANPRFKRLSTQGPRNTHLRPGFAFRSSVRPPRLYDLLSNLPPGASRIGFEDKRTLIGENEAPGLEEEVEGEVESAVSYGLSRRARSLESVVV